MKHPSLKATTRLPETDSEAVVALVDRLAESMADTGDVLANSGYSSLTDAARSLTRYRLFETLISHVPDVLWVKDRQSRFVFANPAMLKASKFKTLESMIGICDFDFHEIDDAIKFFEVEQELMREDRRAIAMEETVTESDGQIRVLSTSKIPIHDDSGNVIGLVGISHDITARKKADALQRGQGSLLEMVALNRPLPEVLEALVYLAEEQMQGFSGSVLLLDQTGQYLQHGAAPSLPQEWCRMIDGVKIGLGVGSCGTSAFLRQPVFVDDIFESPHWVDFREMARPFGFRSCWSTPIISHSGSVLGTFALYSSEVRTATEPMLRLVGMVTHIAGIAIDRKLAEDRFTHLAHHDTLTGLPNRSLLNETIRTCLTQARAASSGLVVAFLDLDNFKDVNDSLGHGMGDELLKCVALRMTEIVGDGGRLFRMGGDEFVFVLEDERPDCANAWQKLRTIHASFATPIEIEGHVLSSTCSLGAACFPENDSDAEQLITQADIAMYRSKLMGRDMCTRFSAEMESASKDRRLLSDLLRSAVERDELLLHYQPQVRQSTGEIFGVEALVRWISPERGMVPPNVFIPLAEESGLIQDIGHWVLVEACRQARRWQDDGFADLTMSVNVSARQFRDAGFAAMVARTLAETGLAPHCLELELTESMIMHDVGKAVSIMRTLEALGVKMAIDDFGTGYSSLSALKSFPVSRLKVDQSFVRGLPDDEGDCTIASAVISMAQKLRLKVIAEGVETQEQAEFLRDAGCDELQGYLISRPVGSDAMAHLLRQWQNRGPGNLFAASGRIGMA